MDNVLRCDCGFEVLSADEAELVAAVRRHAATAHAMTMTREHALAILLRSELEQEVEPRIGRAETNERRKK